MEDFNYEKKSFSIDLSIGDHLDNGNIAFAAEADNENTTDTMVMEEAVGESTQPKQEEDTESEEPEKVAEDDPAETETVAVTSIDTTSENITVETSEDVPEQGYTKSGTYGENITWNFDEATGTLTFSGSGDMADTPAGEFTPWEKNFRTEVKHIIINDGITNIGMNAFYTIEKLRIFTFHKV